MIDRRDFLKIAATASGMGLVRPIPVLARRSRTSSGYFSVHPFIESHPEAVFIMHTDVDIKTNTRAKKNVGLLMIILAIFLPFVAVFLKKGVGKDLIINIILCIFFYLPGIIHAFWVIL